MTARMLLAMVASALAICPLRPAVADILLESHRVDRPADADRLLAPLREELAAAGVAVLPADVIAAAGDQLPLPGTVDPALGPPYPADARAEVELGTTQVFRGDYEAGLATLQRVVEAARASPALAVADAASPGWLTKAHAAIAFAHLRSDRRDAAIEAIAAQIRSFPDQPIGRLLGPEVAALADSVRKGLDAEPHGTLRVTVSRPDAQLFLNEQPRARESLDKLPAGDHRLLVVRSGIARRYTARVLPDRSTELHIEWDDDALFQVARSWIGFAWPRGRTDGTEPAVTRYAKAGWRHDILVVGIVEQGGRRFVAGRIFEKGTGALLRSRSYAVGRDDSECGRALSRYLLEGKQAPCLLDVERTDNILAGVEKLGDPFAASGIVASVGVLALAGGSVLLVLDEDPAGPLGPPTVRELAWPGIGLMVAGGVSLGTAAYLSHRAFRETSDGGAALRRSRAPFYAAATTALAAYAVGGYMLAISGKGTCGVEGDTACPYQYTTAPYGYALLGTGLVATAFSVYWLTSAPRHSGAAGLGFLPVRGGGLAALAASF